MYSHFTDYSNISTLVESHEVDHAIVRFTKDGTILFVSDSYSVYHYLSGKTQTNFLHCFYDYFHDFTKKAIVDLFDSVHNSFHEFSVELHFDSVILAEPVPSNLKIEKIDENHIATLVMPLFINDTKEQHFFSNSLPSTPSLQLLKKKQSLHFDDVDFFHTITQASTILADNAPGEDAITASLLIVQKVLKSSAMYITQVMGENNSPLMVPRYECKNNNVTKWDDDANSMLFQDLGLMRWYNVLSRKGVILGNIIDFSPDEAQVLESIGLRSVLILPVFVRSELWGFVEFDYYDKENEWEDIHIAIVKSYAAAIGNYFVREQEQKMLKSFTEDLYEAKKILESQAYDLVQKNYELEIAREEADNANKTKSAFLSSMSHELRTPLNAIIGFSQILQKDQSMPEQFRSSINMMYRSGTHLLDMINDILDLSKIEAGKMEFYPETVDLYALLDDILGMFSLRCKEKDLWMKVEKPDESARFVTTDAKRLKQVLINFIGNSVKFTQKGGINVIVKNNTVQNSLSTLTFSVTDTGRGIPKEQCESIFEPFQQVKGTYSEGTGLGLAICQKIVRMMGGDGVKVSSEIGRGSTFYFDVDLPVVVAAKAIPDSRQNSAIIGIKGEKRVIIADKSEINRVVIKGFLEPIGFSVFEATTITEVSDIVAENFVDGIIADFDLFSEVPFAGSMFQNNLQSLKIPIIVVSANALTDNREIAISLGFNEFVPKPFHENQLLEAIRRALTIEFQTDNAMDESGTANGTRESVNIKLWLESLSSDFASQIRDAIEFQDFEHIENLLTQLDDKEQQHDAVVTLLSICASQSYKDIIEVLSQIEN